MKRLLFVFLISGLCFVISCTTPIETKLRGTWQIDSVKIDKVIPADEIEEYNTMLNAIKENTMVTLYAGHTYEFEFDGKTREGTWELSNDNRYLIVNYNAGKDRDSMIIQEINKKEMVLIDESGENSIKILLKKMELDKETLRNF